MAPRERDDPSPAREFLDESPVSKQEVYLELGLRPAWFLVLLVREDGGRMWQEELVETTGWSESTVSDYLGRLESDGTLERVRVGRRELVRVPDEPSETVPPGDGFTGRPLRQ